MSWSLIPPARWWRISAKSPLAGFGGTTEKALVSLRFEWLLREAPLSTKRVLPTAPTPICRHAKCEGLLPPAPLPAQQGELLGESSQPPSP